MAVVEVLQGALEGVLRDVLGEGVQYDFWDEREVLGVLEGHLFEQQVGLAVAEEQRWLGVLVDAVVEEERGVLWEERRVLRA